MGKKERAIKKLNKDFYKEYNNENNEQLIKQEEFKFEKQRLLAEKRERDDDKLCNVGGCIIRDMREYTDSQGLCLCENLDSINMDRFMEFVFTQPVYKEREPEREREPMVVDPPLSEITRSSDELEKDIAAITLDIARRRSEYITEAGEAMLFRNYIHDNYKGRIPDDMKIEKTKALLLTKLKKIAGNPKKYNDLVNNFGEAEYAKSVNTLGL